MKFVNYGIVNDVIIDWELFWNSVAREIGEMLPNFC